MNLGESSEKVCANIQVDFATRPEKLRRLYLK
jgi:hypothetical protein